jgi:hypothetical protein
VPDAVTLNAALWPAVTVIFAGFVVIASAWALAVARLFDSRVHLFSDFPICRILIFARRFRRSPHVLNLNPSRRWFEGDAFDHRERNREVGGLAAFRETTD